MLRWCATHWRPASIFLRLCTRNDFASPSATLLRALSNPTATTPSLFITPSSIPSSILLLFPTIVCYYARYYSAPYYDSFNLLPIFINFVFFLFFWISFIQDLVWFIDFQFLIFSSSYSFPYPGNTLSGRSVQFVQSAIKTFVAWINKEIYAYSGIFRWNFCEYVECKELYVVFDVTL